MAARHPDVTISILPLAKNGHAPHSPALCIEVRACFTGKGEFSGRTVRREVAGETTVEALQQQGVEAEIELLSTIRTILEKRKAEGDAALASLNALNERSAST